MDRLRMADGLARAAAMARALGAGRLVRSGRRLTNALLADSLHTSVDGLRLTGSIEHRGYLDGLRQGTMENLQARLFAEAVRPGMTVVDVGAFIGWYSLLGGRATGPGGRVHAFEPDPGNFRRLVRNVALNGLAERVRTVEKAVLDTHGKRQLHVVEGEPSQNSLFLSLPEAVGATVECTSLDEELPDEAVADVVKIDVEGAEVKVLQGMRRLLERDRPMVIFVECLAPGLEAAGTSGGELGQILVDAGFSLWLIDEQRERCDPCSPERLAETAYGNVVCRRGTEAAR